MQTKSIVFAVLVAVAGAATGLAQADPVHAGLWHGLAAAATLASSYFGLTSPDVSAKPPQLPPQPEERL